jgi:hypothetical protein
MRVQVDDLPRVESTSRLGDRRCKRFGVVNESAFVFGEDSPY